MHDAPRLETITGFSPRRGGTDELALNGYTRTCKDQGNPTVQRRGGPVCLPDGEFDWGGTPANVTGEQSLTGSLMGSLTGAVHQQMSPGNRV